MELDLASQYHRTRLRAVATVAIVISLILIVMTLWNSYRSEKLSERDIAQSIELQKLSADLRYYDEVLTMSASMAASTGDLRWEQRFIRYAEKLDHAILSASNPATSQLLAQLAGINDQLIAVELRIFELSQQQQLSQAMALINGDQYLRLKAKYALILDKLSGVLTGQSQLALSDSRLRQQKRMLILGALMVMLVTIWAYLIYTARKWRQEILNYNSELSKLAHYDTLTGIANRSLFQMNLMAALAGSRRGGKAVALLLLDLDSFKEVNDNLGHPAGDELLIAIASRIKRNCRETDTVARLGGDEFAIIITGLAEGAMAEVAVQKILELCRKPVTVSGNVLHAFASIGIALFPEDAENEEELFRKADLALYEAKAAGRNTFAFFTDEMDRQLKTG